MLQRNQVTVLPSLGAIREVCDVRVSRVHDNAMTMSLAMVRCAFEVKAQNEEGKVDEQLEAGKE